MVNRNLNHHIDYLMCQEQELKQEIIFLENEIENKNFILKTLKEKYLEVNRQRKNYLNIKFNK